MARRPLWLTNVKWFSSFSSTMFFEFHILFYFATCILVIHNAPALKPKKPKVFGFGWPPALVNVSAETVHFKGIVQYTLQVDSTACGSNYTEASLIDVCHFVENQANAALSSVGRSLDCTICNSTENCKSLGIALYGSFGLWFSVKAHNLSYHNCIGRQYIDIVVIPPPRSIQLSARDQRKLTVFWEGPRKIANRSWEAPLTACQIMALQLLNVQLGNCLKHLSHINKGSMHTAKYTFTSVLPWTDYSVTVCCAFYGIQISVNKSWCTCGDSSHVIPGGPVVMRTLPEEPAEAPHLQPCEAVCGDKYFNVTLKWKASVQQVWNGIPVKSVITVWNSSAFDDQKNFSIPVAMLSVPLSEDYNGSLVSYTIHNLSSTVTYHVKVEFCSNGGCGPAGDGTVSCETCVIISGTPSAKHVDSWRPDSYALIVMIVGACLSCLLIVLAISWFYWKRKQRERQHRPPLEDVLGDVMPGNYDEISFSDLPPDSVPYSLIGAPETQGLLPSSQSGERI